MVRGAMFIVSLAVVAIAVVPGIRSLTAASEQVRHLETVPLSSASNHIAVIGDSYTAGFEDMGRGAANWTERAWQALASRGVSVVADVTAEGGAGYGVRGNHGSLFSDLTARTVQPDDTVVVFFGSRNDQDVDPGVLTRMIADTLGQARRAAPAARLLVIGPPWPTADVPGSVWRTRDILNNEARGLGAKFVDPLAERWFVGLPDLIGADGVHPTDAGHAYLADKIGPLIIADLPKSD